MSDFDDTSPTIERRLRDGFERLAHVLRADDWRLSERFGLTPTQWHILVLLAGRGEGGMRNGEIAAHLGVSQPTVTDSAQALIRKGLVEKSADPADARAVALRLSAAGRSLVAEAGGARNPVEAALAALSPTAQEALLGQIMRLIRALQEAGAIAPQRLCVTCKYFQPYRHGGEAPHHCAFVNAAMRDRDIRLDCGEHETAAPAARTAIWTAFETGVASLNPPG